MKQFLSLLLMLVAVSSYAVPAWPGARRTVTLADGSRITCRLVGDEHGHRLVTDQGLALTPIATCDTLYRYMTADELHVAEEASEARRGAIRKGQLMGFPTIGEVHGLVILTEFADVQFQPQHDHDLYDRQINESGYSDYRGTGSARDFFIAQSDSLFMVKFDVVGPVRLPRDEEYYGRNNLATEQDGQAALMIKDACQIVHDSLGIDFSQYDYDENGEVDFVFCIYAGYGENYGALSTTIWPHMSFLNAYYVYLELDGKSVNRYACSCELNGATGTKIDGIGPLCHEFSHVIGLPDMYNTTYTSDVQLGPWDTMDAGNYNNDSRTPPNYSAFERYSLGWMDLTELTEPADTIVVPELGSSHKAYRISTSRPDEYFVLENRQQQGWDAYQPGRGMLIFHIDYDESLWNNNRVNNSLHPHYDLVEADGSQGAPYNDAYPTASNDLFTDYSKPASLSWDGEPTEKGVSRIRQEENGDITFAFMRDRIRRPRLDEVTALTDTSMLVSWQPVDEADAYRLHIVELLPDSINPLLLDLDGTVVPDGWSATETYEADGLLRIGSYGVSGSLKSPWVKPLPDTTTLTLLFDARAYPGKSVNYDVTLTAADGTVLNKQTLKAKRDMERHLILYENVPDQQMRLTIETTKERLFLDDLRLVCGVCDTTDIWTVGPAEWEIDAIDDTQYLLTGLAPCRGYTLDLTALCLDNPMRNSTASQPLTVFTLPEGQSGIEQIGIDDTPSSLATPCYDLMGRRRDPHTPGLTIRSGRVTWVR